MNWDQVEGKWKQLKGSAKQHWGEFTNDDLEAISGHRDKLVGKLQERYGYAREQAQKAADDWLKTVHEPAHATTSQPTGSETGSQPPRSQDRPEHHAPRR